MKILLKSLIAACVIAGSVNQSSAQLYLDPASLIQVFIMAKEKSDYDIMMKTNWSYKTLVASIVKMDVCPYQDLSDEISLEVSNTSKLINLSIEETLKVAKKDSAKVLKSWKDEDYNSYSFKNACQYSVRVLRRSKEFFEILPPTEKR